MKRLLIVVHLRVYGLLVMLVLFAMVWLTCNGRDPGGPVQDCSLTVIAAAGGEIISPAQSVIEVISGASVTVVARPLRGYVFARWTVFGDNATVAYQNAAAATVTLTGDDTVRAEFLSVPALPGNLDLSSIPTENGVNFQRYKGSWTKLPNFTALAPDTAGPADTFGLSALPYSAQNFGAELSAYLTIPLDGNYTFFLKSSDGSALYVNDSLVISNDGIHPAPEEDSVTLPLTQGAYLLHVRYFVSSSAPFLDVSYACADLGIDKMSIPKDALYRADTRPAVKIFVTQPAGGENFRLGDTIRIRWNYKNPRGQVYAQLSVDNGKRFQNISIHAFPGNVTSYDWCIPPGADSLVTQTALIRVEEYPPFNVYGTSGMFAIVKQ